MLIIVRDRVLRGQGGSLGVCLAVFQCPKGETGVAEVVW